jgi:hypothetical protein
VNAAALNLGASSVGSGTLTVTASGPITQTGALAQAIGAGAATFNAGANPITLTNMGNIFTGAVSFNNSGLNDVSLYNNTDINLGSSQLGSGSFTVTANGNITQDAAITSGGNAVFNAGTANDVSLTSNNDFAGLGIASANNVTINDINSINLTTSSVLGNYTITGNGAITQSGNIVANSGSSTTTLSAGSGNNISLSLNNDFNSVVIANTNDVSINDINELSFDTSTILGNLIATANGDLTQTGVLNVSGSSSFNAGAHLIRLDELNQLSGPVSLANLGNNDVVLINASDLVIGTTSVGTGDLAITAAGAISQVGIITQADNASSATFDAGNHAISLTANNELTGAVSLNNSGNHNVALTNNRSLVFANSTLGTGSLTVVANGDISQTGFITQQIGADTASFTVGTTNQITLDNVNNHFSRFGTLSANNVIINDANQLDLASISITGNLTINILGALTQSGALTINQTGAVSTFNVGNANNINLGNVNNNFYSVSILNANDVTLQDADTINMASTNLAGTLEINAAGAITQSSTINADVLDANAVTGIALAGNNTVNEFSATNTTSGDIVLSNTAAPLEITSINQASSGDVSVTNTGAMFTSGSITTDGGDVSLSTISNDSTLKALTINGAIDTNGGSISANSANPLGQDHALIVSGQLNTSPGTGGMLVIGGSTDLLTSPIVGAGSISLQGNGADLTIGGLTFDTPVEFAVNRYLTVNGNLTTNGGVNLSLVGDNDNDGSGGVFITNGAIINSSGELYIKGSNLAGLPVTDVNAGIEMSAGTALQAVGNISLNGNVGNSDIVLNGNVTATGLGSTVTTTATGSGIAFLGANVSSNSGAISFNSPVELLNSVTVNAANALINFGSSVTGLTSELTLQNNSSANGTVTFAGDVNLQNIITFAQPYQVIFTGGSNTIPLLDTFLNTGGIRLGDGNDTFTFDLGLNYAGQTELGGSINSGDDINLSHIDVSQNSLLNAQSHSITIGEVTGSGGLTLVGNHITANNDINIGGAISFLGNAILGASNIYASNGATFGVSSSNNLNLTQPLYVTTSNTPIVFNTKINGAVDLTLNAGSAGDISFASDVGALTSLNNISILNARNVEGQGLLSANQFSQFVGSGTTIFNGVGLAITGTANITTNTLNGTLNVNALTINLSNGDMFGSVNGLTGEAAIRAMTVLNTIIPNRIYFDGIDISTVLIPPIPPQPADNGVINPGTILPTNYTSPNQSEVGLLPTVNDSIFYDMSNNIPSIKNPKLVNKNCVAVSANITICSGL